MPPKKHFKPSDYPNFLLYVLDKVSRNDMRMPLTFPQTHVTVTAATALAILWTHDAHTVWFGIGAVGSTLVGQWCLVL